MNLTYILYSYLQNFAFGTETPFVCMSPVSQEHQITLYNCIFLIIIQYSVSLCVIQEFYQQYFYISLQIFDKMINNIGPSINTRGNAPKYLNLKSIDSDIDTNMLDSSYSI